jgi:transcriptional regulator with PAS, ATPase and Fis domain
VREDRFRLDLLSRMRRRILVIPPLSDRKEDILAFLESRRREHDFDSRFLLVLLRHSWPENIRELRDVIAAALDRTKRESEKLTLDHLSFEDSSIVPAVRAMRDEEVEGEITRQLVHLLERTGLRLGEGLQKEMARLMGVSEPTISRRIKRHIYRSATGQPTSENSK